MAAPFTAPATLSTIISITTPTPTSEGEGLHAPFLPYRHKGDKSFEFITGENLSIHHEDNLEKLLNLYS